MISDNEIRGMREAFKVLEKKIKEAPRIIVYRHVSPDFDALGAQMGLVTWIKDNYPDKEVHFIGDSLTTVMPSLYPFPETVPEAWFTKEHLAITVDVGDRPRIAGGDHLKFAKEVIKIDHHPLPQPEKDFGDLKFVYPDRPAVSEVLALFALSRKRKLVFSKAAAGYFFSGIVGDTGRFLYQDTDGATFRIASDLIDKGIDKTDIYNKMYETDVRRMNILKYCLNNYHLTEKGTCYYVLTDQTMKDLSMTIDEGNLHINTFRNMKGVNVVASITEDITTHDYRVSLRSIGKKVAPVAEQFEGGGHDFAAGCRLKSLEDLPKLIAALDQLN
jgi:phosphoesterase RecJ-like protein